ncbi:hypothetical protein TIFTF001_037358 [Ficus carica]|uniref:Uncharacterized protein n=1 Tax=Ficus carica TaxID=3494 RepID=A0AA88E557_FICCA|nr:hypothetical protein TIFTF001_037358 [Ficus carica]
MLKLEKIVPKVSPFFFIRDGAGLSFGIEGDVALTRKYSLLKWKAEEGKREPKCFVRRGAQAADLEDWKELYIGMIYCI